MQHLRITTPAHLTDAVVAQFTDDPAVSHLAVLRGASSTAFDDDEEDDTDEGQERQLLLSDAPH